MADDEESVEKAIVTLLSVALISQDSVDSNFVPIMVNSGVLGHYFDDAIL